MVSATFISAAVEGPVDEAVVRKLVDLAGGRTGGVYGRNGRPALRQRISGYNNAARHSPWVVLVDLENEADCAPPIRDEWVPAPAPNLCFRVVVRAVEAWLMADEQTLASYLSVRPARIPAVPEEVDHPKDAMVSLARQSRRKDILQDMVPRERSGRRVGPAYTSRLIEYVQEHWRPEVAAKRSESLQRAIRCLRRLVDTDRKEECSVTA